MPHLVCPRCQHANPAEAQFCWFDGLALQVGPGPVRPAPTAQLPHEFMFPSGRSCRTFDELWQACQEEWTEAKGLLHRGVFAQFLAGIGRMDLAQAAIQAQAQTEGDVALDSFLRALPVTQTQTPRLDLKPRRLNLGALRTGDVCQVKLTILNEGKGLLHGTLTVAAGEQWLSVVDGETPGQCALRTPREQTVGLRIDTRGLAAPQKYATTLTVITNGGVVDVPVTMELRPLPFPKPPFQGASTRRQLAELILKQPKAAVPLLEAGDVERWFVTNGWPYPVVGAPAKGLAAVQQLFEAMGLTKPPPIELSEQELHFVCIQPEVAPGKVALRTDTKKWLYATVESDMPWLRVTTPHISGPQQVEAAFEVDSTLMDANRTYTGTLLLQANAGQLYSVRVIVDVRRGQEPFTRRLLRPFLGGALLGFCSRLLLALPADLYARAWTAPQQPAGAFATWLESPLNSERLARHFVGHFVLATWWLGGVGGAILLWRRGSRWSDAVYGLLAGSVAGLSGSATFACLLAWIDDLPRLVWQQLAGVLSETGMIVATSLWLLVAAGCWAMMGALLGSASRLLITSRKRET